MSTNTGKTAHSQPQKSVRGGTWLLGPPLHCDANGCVLKIEMALKQFESRELALALEKRKQGGPHKGDVEDYVRRAVLEQAARDLCPGQPFIDLENAVTEATGLMHLLSERLQDLMGKDSETVRCFAAGIVLLRDSLSERLRKASGAVIKYPDLAC